jgi:hypothetical protein
MDTKLNEEIRGALARAYTHAVNCRKELDSDLINAMEAELMPVINSHYISRDTVRGEIETFSKLERESMTTGLIEAILQAKESLPLGDSLNEREMGFISGKHDAFNDALSLIQPKERKEEV